MRIVTIRSKDTSFDGRTQLAWNVIHLKFNRLFQNRVTHDSFSEFFLFDPSDKPRLAKNSYLKEIKSAIRFFDVSIDRHFIFRLVNLVCGFSAAWCRRESRLKITFVVYWFSRSYPADSHLNAVSVRRTIGTISLSIEFDWILLWKNEGKESEYYLVAITTNG